MPKPTQNSGYKEISQKIEELESEKKVLAAAIMEKMQSSSMKVPGFLVRRYTRLSIKVDIEQARFLNAVQMVESIDKDKIKELYKSGYAINGVSETQYIQVVKQ